MKRFVRGCAVGLLMLVAACASKPPASDLLNPIGDKTAITAAPDSAVLVVGYLVKDRVPPTWTNRAPPAMVSWVKIEPSTRLRVAREMPFFHRSGGCCVDTGTRYAVYIVAPGSYALGWVRYNDSYQPTQFESIQMLGVGGYEDTPARYLFSSRARAQPVAPTFQISAGEVVYIGDLTLDFHATDRLNWSFQRDDEAARASLQNPDIAARMVYRAPKRADGAPVKAGDGVMLKWY